MRRMNPHLTNKGSNPSLGAYFEKSSIRLTQTALFTLDITSFMETYADTSDLYH
jgi:hypothetical protein